jgi:hypothetical protein
MVRRTNLDELLGQFGDHVKVFSGRMRFCISYGFEFHGEVIEQRQIVLRSDEIKVELDIPVIQVSFLTQTLDRG